MGLLDWLGDLFSGGDNTKRRTNPGAAGALAQSYNARLSPLNQMQSRGSGVPATVRVGNTVMSPTAARALSSTRPVNSLGRPYDPKSGIAGLIGRNNWPPNQVPPLLRPTATSGLPSTGIDASGIQSFLDQFFGETQTSPGRASELAAAEFGPQIEAIQAMLDAATNRNNESQKAVGDMYAALAAAIRADEPNVTATFDTAAQNIGQGFDTAKSDIEANYQGSAADMEAMMRRLGVEAAAPSALAPGAEGRAQDTSMMDQFKAINVGAQDANKASASEYNTQQAQNAGYAGANAQADLTRQLNDILAQGEMQRLQLQGQQAGRETDLMLGLEDRNFQRQQSAAQFASELMRMQYEAQQAAAQAGGSGSSAAGGPNFDDEWKSLDPWSRINFQVAQQTGNPQKAADIVTFVRDMISRHDLTAPDAMGREPTPAQIATAVRSHNRKGSGIPSQMIDLVVSAMAEQGYL